MPSQKPHVENNHEFIRDIILKKKSMSNLTQDKLDLMFSHINSVPRKSLGGKTPYEAFEFTRLSASFFCLYPHFTLKISKNQCFSIKFLLINSIYSVTRIYFFQIEFNFSIDLLIVSCLCTLIKIND